MPVLIIYGMPEQAGAPPLFIEPYLPDLVKKLQVAAVKVLDLPGSGVSVFFPVDRMAEGLGEEIVCIVEGLFEKPERTIERRQELAATLRSTLYDFVRVNLQNCKKVEVIVKRFNQDLDGFADCYPGGA